MCGIAGFCDFSKKTDRETLVKMTDALRHRGPDDSGYSFYKNEYAYIGLGHRRLSILDLSSHGHQPMSYEHLEIVFNGEVYNFKEIKLELEGYGYTFDSHTDTEVILKAYHKWGIDAVSKFNGMFAFAIYDKAKEILTIARDEMGIKPLFYIYENDCFKFASEVKSFGKFELNKEILNEYMGFRFCNSEDTFIKNVKVFPKGEIWTITHKCIKRKKYSFKYHRNTKSKKIEDRIEELLLDAIEKQIYADVPVGFFLSGGVDSSLLVSMASKYFKRTFNTYSVSFENYEYSEHYYQSLVVKDSKTIHHNFVSNHRNYFDDYIYTSSKSDTPLLIPNYTQIYQLAKIAKNEVTVLLSGEGADELFGGYHRFRTTKIVYFVNTNGLGFVFKLLSYINNKYSKHIIKRNDVFKYYRNSMRYCTVDNIKKYTYFNLQLEQLEQEQYSVLDFNELLKFDQNVYLNGLLQRLDNMTMLASIESRVPFLDQRIVQLVNELPFDSKVGFKNRKKIIYNIAKKYVPKEIIRRRKVGFSIPLGDWFCESHGIGLLKNILLDERSRQRNFYNQDRLKELFKNPLHIKQHSESVIFPLVSLELWIRTFIEGDNIEKYNFSQIQTV